MSSNDFPAQPVEAESLSSLNYLLANPPQYPRNPAHAVLKPLVLYILRVPGSKDVFLTPLKPPTKASIGLESIQSSLYYLHVHTSQDDTIRNSIDSETSTKYATSNPQPLHRKPLPPIPGPPLPPRHPTDIQTQPYAYDHWASGKTTQARERSHTQDRSTFEHGDLDLKLPRRISRESVGTQANRFSQSKSMLQEDPADTRRRSHYGVRDDPYLQTSVTEHDKPFQGSGRIYGHDENIRISFESGPTRRSPTRSTMEQHTQNRASVSHPHITLIRRDPVSGAQWNVGSIDQLQNSTINSGLKPTVIKIETPGYYSFANQPEYPWSGAAALDANSLKQTIVSGDYSPSPIERENDEIPQFTRTVQFRSQPNHFKLNRRTSSYDSVPNYPIQDKPSQSVYSFSSPWQGLCIFSNGIDGKSLKCRHVLPSRTSHETDSIAMNVAELRFNLAWSVLSPRDTNKRSNLASIDSDFEAQPISSLLKDPKSTKQAWRRSVQHIKTMSEDFKAQLDRDKRDKSNIEAAYASNTGGSAHTERFKYRSSQSESTITDRESGEDLADRLSLKLGREKAGGGFKGNSAKLGKLIIEDEGLKMGDLVVAACMSVWWQHYTGSVGL